MPWKDARQQAAVFLSMKRKKGEKYARDYMRKHGGVKKKRGKHT